MPLNIIFNVLALTAVYVLIIWLIAALLRQVKALKNLFLGLAFLLFGFASSLLAAWLWPFDSAVYPNLYALLLGDKLYITVTNWLADPALPSGHRPVPWIFELPWVYIMTGSLFFGLIGLLLQVAANRRMSSG